MSEQIDLPDATDDPIASKLALRWTAWAMAVATLGLALCNAESARSWSEGLPPSLISQPIGVVCEGWANLTEAVHLSAPRDVVRAAWRGRHDLTWDGSGKRGGPAQPAGPALPPPAQPQAVAQR